MRRKFLQKLQLVSFRTDISFYYSNTPILFIIKARIDKQKRNGKNYNVWLYFMLAGFDEPYNIHLMFAKISHCIISFSFGSILATSTNKKILIKENAIILSFSIASSSHYKSVFSLFMYDFIKYS